MHSISLASAALVLAVSSAFAADGHFDRTLTANPGTNLVVETGSGYIHVTPGNDNQLHISAQVHGNRGWMGGGDVEARIRQIVANPPVHQSGNNVTVGESGHGLADVFRNISIDYEIQAPRNMTVHASTGSGDVQVQDSGPNSSLTSGSGSIRANNLHGAVVLQSGSGDIQMQQSTPGDVKAQTGSGSIRINGFAGGLHAQTGSGDIQVEGHPTGEWKLETGSGSIRLGVGNDAHFTVDGDTGSGTIHVSQPITMQGNIGKNHVHGIVNGGGPLIKAFTGSGDVEIH